MRSKRNTTRSDYQPTPTAILPKVSRLPDVVVILDTTGSMNGNPLDVAKTSIQALFETFSGIGGNFTVLAYGSETSDESTFRPLIGDSDTTKQLQEALMTCSAIGTGTAAYSLVAAWSRLHKINTSNRHIIILSDGDESATERSVVEELIATIAKQGIHVCHIIPCASGVSLCSDYRYADTEEAAIREVHAVVGIPEIQHPSNDPVEEAVGRYLSVKSESFNRCMARFGEKMTQVGAIIGYGPNGEGGVTFQCKSGEFFATAVRPDGYFRLTHTSGGDVADNSSNHNYTSIQYLLVHLAEAIAASDSVLTEKQCTRAVA